MRAPLHVLSLLVPCLAACAEASAPSPPAPAAPAAPAAPVAPPVPAPPVAPAAPVAVATPSEAPSTVAPVGSAAPEFAAPSDEGKTVKLSDHAGKSAFLLAFYPADFTSGCTTELSEFRDKHEAFVKAGVQVYGVSVDPAEKHKEFRASLSLPFPLLADVDGTLSRAYDSLREGDGSFRSARKLVLVGRDGKIAYRDERYEVGNEAEFAALVAAMEQLPAP